MEKDHLSEKIKDLILEMEALGSQKNNFEEELRTRVEEIASLKDEMLGLHGKVSGMDQTISERGLEFSVLHEKHASRETEHMSLKEHANNLQQELDSLQKERSELQSQLESQQKEFSAKMTEIENQKSELATQVADLQKLLDEQTEAYKKLSDDYKQVEALYEESKANAEAAEKKAEDFSKQIAELLDTIESQKRDLEFKGDELRSLADKNNNIQVKLRLSSQKGRVTDQLLSEHEETFRKEEAKYKEKQRELEARISTLSITNEAHRKMVTDLSDKIHSNITGLDTLSSRFHEDCDRYQHRILEMSCEIQIAKSWVVDMNKQMENLNKEANSSALQLQHTRQQESALKIAVEELQAKASKEETEKQNLTNKVAAMETSMKEKDEGMFHLGEQKREAYWVPVSVSTTQRINTKTISQLI
ncbi:COP1-interactive protein 1 [Linum perenne]